MILSVAVGTQRENKVEIGEVRLLRLKNAPSAIDDRSIWRISPLTDPRWEPFVQKHPRASVFHSSAWLKALSETYGYQPVAFAMSDSGSDLENAILFCEIDSWLTGPRLVSLPFSDHCEPLAEPEIAAAIVSRTIHQELDRDRLRYVEIRPLRPIAFATQMHLTRVPYKFHEVDLRPNLDTLYDNLHYDSIQRKIRRAEREGLTLREGVTEELLDDFYSLLKLTRERHRVPPQP